MMTPTHSLETRPVSRFSQGLIDAAKSPSEVLVRSSILLPPCSLRLACLGVKPRQRAERPWLVTLSIPAWIVSCSGGRRSPHFVGWGARKAAELLAELLKDRHARRSRVHCLPCWSVPAIQAAAFAVHP